MANSEQAAQWNGPQGLNWLASDTALEALMTETDAILFAAAAAAPGESVLDIGCGTGGGAITYAKAVGPAGRVLGVDIAEPLLARAAERREAAGAANLAFLRADAQTNAFDEGAFDLVVSRFGVMFFDDPVAAFRNIAGALRPGGRIAFVAWAALDRNPWFAVPQAAAAARLGAVAPADPDAPGPMAFHNLDRVAGILRAAGLENVTGTRRTFQLAAPDADALVELATRLGPAARLIREREAGEADVAAIAAEVRARFADVGTAGGARIPGEINLFQARRA